MKLRTLFLFLTVLLTTASHATDLELRVPRGRYEDCEFIGLGPKGSIKGSITITETATDPEWSASVAFILIEDTKPSHTFRLALASVSYSKKLEARYELFSDEQCLVAEALSEIAVGEPLTYQLAWEPNGHVRLVVGNNSPRNLLLDVRPSRAFALISGSHGKIHTEGEEKLDCSHSLVTSEEK